MTNMRFWDQLKTTDPAYTKKVEFGRKFTSINSQWQLMQMTKMFGPIGQGWGYGVAHSVERIAPDYVLAIADVTIWWDAGDANHCAYGPVRGMSPIVEPGKGSPRLDDDAGKKAMTDALTKGLSHLGLSADVFLGLYDDNKYVQSLKQQFAEGSVNPPVNGVDGPGSSWGPKGKQGAVDDAREDGLMDTPKLSPDGLAKVKKKVDAGISTMKLSGQSTNSLDTFWKASKAEFDWIKHNVPAEYKRLEAVYNDARDAAEARMPANTLMAGD